MLIKKSELDKMLARKAVLEAIEKVSEYDPRLLDHSLRALKTFSEFADSKPDSIVVGGSLDVFV